jgi:multidrug efflux pump subunit AcrB
VISKFFIERPVLANVIAILVMVIGAVALYSLPVAQYPDVVPPTVQVTTRYPGASAPGLTGRMYAQFALVIAATALLSAINAVTL